MRIGWLEDQSEYIGGQELSMRALRDHSPYEVLYIPPDYHHVGLDHEVDAFVVGNCVTYPAEIIKLLSTAPVVKRVADWWLHGDKILREWLLQKSSRLVFCSPLHMHQFPYVIGDDVMCEICQPPVDFEPFHQARDQVNSDMRRGTLWLGHMHDPVRKGVDLALRWAIRNDEIVDFYGEGAPDWLHGNSQARLHPAIEYDEVPILMASYDKFLFLPRHQEAFGRSVPEAHAAGCRLIVNLVPGSVWFILNDRLCTVDEAVASFWMVVTEAINGVTVSARVTST